jgi:hypothetical protein
MAIEETLGTLEEAGRSVGILDGGVGFFGLANLGVKDDHSG